MDLSYDSDGSTKRKKCQKCKAPYLSLTRYVLDRGIAFAVCFIEVHNHGEPEVYITAIIGDWHDDNSQNRVTLACRYGAVVGQSEPACTLLDIPDSFQSSLAINRLTRAEGLNHTRIHEFWQVVDFLLESDKAMHDYLHHPSKYIVKERLKRY